MESNIMETLKIHLTVFFPAVVGGGVFALAIPAGKGQLLNEESTTILISGGRAWMGDAE